MEAQLQIYTSYSLLSSTISIDKLIEKAKEFQLTSLAITDRLVMHGALEFYNACIKANIHPIIGLEADVLIDSEKYAFIFLAKNNDGYAHLVKMSSFLCSHESMAIELDQLKQYANDLFVFSSGSEGIVESLLLKEMDELAKQVVERMLSVFHSNYLFNYQNFHLEHHRKLHKKMNDLQDQYNIKAIGTNAIRYLEKKDALGLEVLLGIKDNRKIVKKEDFFLMHHEQYLKTPEMMNQLFNQQIINQTNQIAKECQVELVYNNYLIPQYPVPKNGKAKDYLYQLCHVGLSKRMNHQVPQEYIKRLRYELEVIDKMGFNDYFLIVWDFILYAKKAGILVGPGRGSSAGSLTAYVLGIIDIDPIQYQLIFERFLNPERISMPDIDIDFPSHRRDEVITYVKNKYGMDHVAHIITFGTFKPKLAIRDVCRILEVPIQKMNTFLKYVSQYPFQSLSQIIEKDANFRGFVLQDRQNKRVYEIIEIIHLLPKNVSTHAAGIVIAKEPLDHMLPMRKDFANQMLMTQFAMGDVERIGLLKMDFLGIQNLSIISNVVDQIRFDDPDFNIIKIPLDDKNTLKLLSRSDTLGIFQLESSGVRDVLRKLHVDDFEDVVAAIALYRPGPMENIPSYIARKHGLEKIEYPHQDLMPLLKNTYGIIVYQEQILQIAQLFGGFSLGKADLLRRAMSKKDEKQMQALEQSFIEGGLKKGYPIKTVKEVYQAMFKFANYGFNRSHAVAYALVAYQMAYLKTRYPLYFMAELLSNNVGSSKKLSQLLVESRRLNIKVSLPSVNLSEDRFVIIDQQILFALTSIAGIGSQMARVIIDERKSNGTYSDFFDFVKRTKELSLKVYENLIDAGALDCFNINRLSLHATLKDAILYREVSSTGFIDEKPMVTIVDNDDTMQMEKEKEVLGIYLSSHPLKNYYQYFNDESIVPLENYPSFQDRIVRSIVYVTSKRIRKTQKTQEMMATLSIQSEFSDGEGIIYPKNYRELNIEIEKGKVYLIEGRVANDHPCKIYINRIKKL